MPDHQDYAERASGVLTALLGDPKLADKAISLKPEEYLYGPGDPPKSLYVVHSGLIRLIDPPSDFLPEPRPVDWLGPGLLLGWSCVLPAEKNLWAQADQPSSVIPMTLADLAGRIGSDTELAVAVITQMAMRLKLAFAETSELIRLEAPQRLARALVRFAAHPTLAEIDKHNDAWTVIRLTHADLAGRTGISRETVSLILSRWRARGLVKTGRRRLHFDHARLQELFIDSNVGDSEDDRDRQPNGEEAAG